jgi:tRNA dimethylallyltransferase
MVSGPSDPLIAVVGPTGSGKSDLALGLAKLFDGRILNCDSLQIYRNFNIGTAKVPERERLGIPHYLIDIADPEETFTAGEYARRAREVLREITTCRKVPILAGGTGFYLRALLDGLAPGPTRDEGLRERLQKREGRRPGSLARILGRLDPATAARIHHRDVHKLIRAVEICLQARKPASEVFRRGRDPLPGYRVLLIGLNPDRAALYARLNTRAERMFESGLLDEVRGLLAAGCSVEAKPFQSLGYKQALQHLSGDLTLAQAIESTQVETRHYAKRQWTWFRRTPDVHWLHGFGTDPSVLAEAQELCRKFLKEFTQPANFPSGAS